MLDNINISNLIYEIRGKQVMLDSDLAILYQCVNGTKSINLAVKRNINKFPERFCFKLTEVERKAILNSINVQRFQFETFEHSINYRKHLPYAFTEQGVAMLASVLRTTTATEISIKIMDAFVQMRKFILNNAHVFERLNQHELKLLEHDNKFDLIFDEFQKEENIKQKIFYEGQIYDAYSLLVELIRKAKKEIIIIDNYVDNKVLDLLTKKNNMVKVIIIGSNNLNLSNLDINKFNKQYPSLIMKHSNKYHDRFIIIDNIILYHLGASLKDLGKKCFAINIIEDKNLLIINNI